MGGDDVGFHSANQVALDPIVLLPNLPVLMVKPASESACRKPDESTAKSVSIDFNGKLLLVIRSKSMEVKSGFRRESEMLSEGENLGVNP